MVIKIFLQFMKIMYTLVEIQEKVILVIMFIREKIKVRKYYLLNESSLIVKELIKDDDELIFSGPILAELIPPEYEDLILDIKV